MSMYPRRPKAEAFYNTVDVVVHLHDPSRSSTEHTTPPCSAHVQMTSSPSSSSKTGEVVDEFRQHDIVVMVLVKNNLRRASPKPYENFDGG